MDIQAYIESGVLELYVMGALTTAEAAEVESYARRHPEVASEIAAIREATSAYVQQLAIQPPAHLKGRVMDAVRSEEKKAPAKVVEMRPRRSNIVGIIAIAASLALIISIGFNYILVNDRTELQAQLVKKTEELKNLNADYDKVYTAYYKLEDKVDMMASPDNKMVHMKGLKNQDVATIIWSQDKKEVYLSLNKLVEAPHGHQYQLWAIVDNKPVDLGVFNADMKNYEMKQMKNVSNATAFAVTVEKTGGSPVPTLESMWLMGGV